MAPQIPPDKLLQILRAEGLTVVEYTGWRDRCRCHTGSHSSAGGTKIRPWEPIHGVTVHITAGGLGSRSVAQYIRDIINGDPAVPSKCQFVVAPDGVVWLNSAGRCNHVGTISKAARDAMIAGNFSTVASQNLRGAQIDGNTHTYGIENITPKSMSSAQRESSVRICAAIARHYGWSGQEAHGHGEVSSSRGFADPNLNMGQFRRDVMARVKTGNTDFPTPSKETPMSDLNSILSTIVYRRIGGFGVDLRQGAEDGGWARDTLTDPAGDVRVELDGLRADIDKALQGIEKLLAASGPPAVAGPVDVDALADAVAERLIARLQRED